MNNPLEQLLLKSKEFRDEKGNYDADVAKIKLSSLADRMNLMRAQCWEDCVRLRGASKDMHTGELVCIDRCSEKHMAAYEVVARTLNQNYAKEDLAAQAPSV